MYTHFVKKTKFICVTFITKRPKLFLNKDSNLPFLGICRSQFPPLIFLAWSWCQKVKITMRTSLRNKRSCEQKDLLKKNCLIIILKDLIKQSVIKHTLWKVSLFGAFQVRIWSEYGKIRTRKSPNMDTFYLVTKSFQFSSTLQFFFFDWLMEKSSTLRHVLNKYFLFILNIIEIQ